MTLAAASSVISFASAQSKPTSAALATPATGETTIILDAFSARAATDNGDNALQSSSGTRVAVDIKSMPFTLEVVPMEIWKDFSVQAFKQQEALSSIPGVSATENNGQFNLRGIQNGAVTGGTFFLQDGFLRMGRIDQSNVERVEVLKGPAAAIYGKNLPGALLMSSPKRQSRGQGMSVKPRPAAWTFTASASAPPVRSYLASSPTASM
jgi:iron complex outermembrane recepter protein